MNNKNLALTVGAMIFGSVGILHFARLFTRSEMVLGGHKIPVQASGLLWCLSWSMASWFLVARNQPR